MHNCFHCLLFKKYDLYNYITACFIYGRVEGMVYQCDMFKKDQCAKPADRIFNND